MDPAVSKAALKLPRLLPSLFTRDPLSRAVRALSQAAREKRAQMFRDAFEFTEATRVLDLGSEIGRNIHAVLAGTPVKLANVYICDIRQPLLEIGAQRYGFVPVLAKEGAPLPFDDGFFDVVYCSSVIEHVTVPKQEIWSTRSERRFVERAAERQAQFAAEIRRLGRQYFVQTPNIHFPVESHSWLPFVGWLPRPLLLSVLSVTNRVWVKSTEPDWRLLDRDDMAALFPDAEIVGERCLGLTKSLIAVKRAQRA